MSGGGRLAGKGLNHKSQMKGKKRSQVFEIALYITLNFRTGKQVRILFKLIFCDMVQAGACDKMRDDRIWESLRNRLDLGLQIICNSKIYGNS